jgi:hypothetical protein
MNAEHVAVARQVFVPGPAGTGDAVAHLDAVAHVEIGHMDGGQRAEVEGVAQKDLFVAVARIVDVAFQPGAGRGDVQAFALVGVAGQRLGQLDVAGDAGQQAAFHGGELHLGAEHVTHDEGRVDLQRLVQRGNGVAPDAQGLAQGFFQNLDALGLFRGGGETSGVVQSHDAKLQSGAICGALPCGARSMPQQAIRVNRALA